MKRSIEELTKNGWNQERAVRNIIDSFENDKVSCYVNKDGSLNFERYAIFGYRELIDYWLFSDWKGRGRCEHFDDFLKAVSYESLKKKAAVDLDSFLLLIEVVYNCYMIVDNVQLNEEKMKKADISKLKKLLDDELNNLQYRADYDEEKELVHIVPINPIIDQEDAILTPKNLKEEINEYKDQLTRGNLKRKREILFNMGNEYEPKVKQLEKIYPALEDAISFLLNRMNVRHNNKERGKYYCEKAATLTSFEQELIYDRLYNLLLLAFAIFENQSRLDYVATLKQMCKKDKDEVEKK
ncbi:MAG: hypothetical protein IJK01_04735 [Clostridia bacterium]|nr:hypothetical protein [Clostridia bacterium]